MANKAPERPKTTDYRIHVKAAYDVLAADMNGKSDPYCVVLGTAHYGTKIKCKSRVIKANLNPVWNFDASLSFVDPNSKIKIEVYDKDAVGKDDFLGEVDVPMDHVDGKMIKLKLQGKKAKGEIEFSVLELGPYTDLDYIGPSWTSYFCDVIADSSVDGRYKLVSDLRREYVKRATTTGKTGHKGLKTDQVMDCIKAVIPSGQTLPADVFKLYEDNNDGVIDFFELCRFIRDIIKLGSGKLPKEAFATQVWFGFSYDDGQVDVKSLRKNLDTLVQEKEKKDPEKLNAKLDEVAERMVKAMDKDNSGVVTADELRDFSHNRGEFIKFVQELNSVPNKS